MTSTPDPWHSKRGVCSRCGEVRWLQTKEFCRRCWFTLRPDRHEASLEAGRRRQRHANPMPVGSTSRIHDRTPAFTRGRGGLPLSTLYNGYAADKERARRVLIYARMIEEHGEILWGRIPPPEDDLDDVLPAEAEPPQDDVPPDED